MATKHDNTANRIARKKGVEYNRSQGPDVATPRQVIEVETVNTVRDGFRQLRGFRRPVYIAGADGAATRAALEGGKGDDRRRHGPAGQRSQTLDAEAEVIARPSQPAPLATAGPRAPS